MAPRIQVLTWLGVAVATVSLLVAVTIWRAISLEQHFSTFLAGDPHSGAHLFQEKGCSYCHPVGGVGGRGAPDLGHTQLAHPSLNGLISTMWNHAPGMWKRMREERIIYPTFNAQEMSNVFAFLYALRYMDEPGNADRGRQLFRSKGCGDCHAINGNGADIGPDLGITSLETPIAWAETMWNHAPEMEARMRELDLQWPHFEGQEMNDLLAYVREGSRGLRNGVDLLPADPDRGWKLFRSKGCINCHAVGDEGGNSGPQLGPSREIPPTIVQFAGSMWNHSPQMWQAMKEKHIERPAFEEREMADVIAFLYRVRYFEPAGSVQTGKEIFARRGCSGCHGPTAEGTPWGPRLDWRRGSVTSITLATALWKHGPKMYERTKERGMAWPVMKEDEICHLLAFLNAPREEIH